MNNVSVIQNFKGGGNNLNLIRLFAAFQVLIGHLHETFAMPEWLKYISCFNGVPIFFTISGFLIYWSYDKNPCWRIYVRNRFLRIYPALVCAFIVTVGLLFAFGILTWEKMFSTSFAMWIFTQMTFLQEFTPTIIRGFGGSSAPNAPLWTISVEILLYVSIPVFWHMTRNFNRHAKAVFFLMVGLVSYAQNQTGFFSDFMSGLSDNGYYLIFIHAINQIVSFFWFFCIGIEVYLYRDMVIPLLANRAGYLLILYLSICAYAYHLGYMPGSYTPKSIELTAHLVLVACIFSIAYTKPDFTNKVMGKTDISYGLYIYHMLILHVFYELGLRQNIYILPAVALSLMAAWCSWTWVEKRCLKLKKTSLYKLSVSSR